MVWEHETVMGCVIRHLADGFIAGRSDDVWRLGTFLIVHMVGSTNVEWI